MRKIILGFLVMLILVLPCSALFSVETEMPVVQPPMVVTTMGQSPGALMFRLVCTRSQIACVQEDLLTAEQLSEMAAGEKCSKDIAELEQERASKGMGAAGIDMNFRGCKGLKLLFLRLKNSE